MTKSTKKESPKQRFLITMDVNPSPGFSSIENKKAFRAEAKALASRFTDGEIKFEDQEGKTEVGRIRSAKVTMWLGAFSIGQAAVAIVAVLFLIAALTIQFLSGSSSTLFIGTLIVGTASLIYFIVDVVRGFPATSVFGVLVAVYSIALSAVSLIKGP